MTELKPTRFEECYELFRRWVREQSGEPFQDFQTGLLAKEEGYKEMLYHEGRKRLGFDSWQDAQIGEGEILRRAIKAIQVNKNNIVASFARYKLINMQKSPPAIRKIEKILFDLYRSDRAPAEVFADLAEAVERKWDLISYLFFLNNWENYMPYLPTNFTKAFKLLGMEPPMPKGCTWEGYQAYLSGLRSVQAELTNHQVPDVRLIDAHSFCWTLPKCEEDLENLNDEIDTTQQEIDTIQDDPIKNLILYGPPGTGKTHLCKRLIQLREEEHDTMRDVIMALSGAMKQRWDGQGWDDEVEKRILSITFHQSYSYEDFIEGFRPVSNAGDEAGEPSGPLRIELAPGRFKQFCKDAEEQPDRRFYLIIDEINRGNISKIFGELITLLEEDKRGQSVTLPYSGADFSIPPNIYVIATMNSTDKSIALVDVALRRRFTFVRFDPQPDLVSDPDARKLMESLNKTIRDKIDADHQIGHSYFMKVRNPADLDFLKRYRLRPLIEEYAYANMELQEELLKIIEAAVRPG